MTTTVRVLLLNILEIRHVFAQMALLSVTPRRTPNTKMGESKNTLNTTLKKMGRPFAKPLGNEKQKTERAFKLIKLVMAKTRSGENIFMQCDLEFDCFATKRFYQKFQTEFSPFS
jgi:hypothetical protein